MIYNVKLTWDNDASVWVATSEDIKGLVLESNSYDALIDKVKVAAPELIELNSNEPVKTINFTSERNVEVA